MDDVVLIHLLFVFVDDTFVLKKLQDPVGATIHFIVLETTKATWENGWAYM